MNASNLSRSAGTVHNIHVLDIHVARSYLVHASILFFLQLYACHRLLLSCRIIFSLGAEGTGGGGGVRGNEFGHLPTTVKNRGILYILFVRAVYSLGTGQWTDTHMAHTYAAKRSIVKCNVVRAKKYLSPTNKT
jgi:hypothetical protein